MIASPLASSIARPAAERAHVASSLDPDAALYQSTTGISTVAAADISAFLTGLDSIGVRSSFVDAGFYQSRFQKSSGGTWYSVMGTANLTATGSPERHRNGVLFDNSDPTSPASPERLYGTIPTLAGQWTILSVSNRDRESVAVSGQRYALNFFQTAGDGGLAKATQFQNSSNWQNYTFAGGVAANINGPQLPAEYRWRLTSMRNADPSGATSFSSDVLNDSASKQTVTGRGNVPIRRLSVGANTNDASAWNGYYDGMVSLWVVFDSVLTDAQLVKIESLVNRTIARRVKWIFDGDSISTADNGWAWGLQTASQWLGRNIDLVTTGFGGETTLHALARMGKQGCNLYISGAPSDNDTVTLNGRTYTWKTTVASADDVKIGASVAESRANFKAAINGEAGAGTLYGTGTTANTLFSAVAGSVDQALYLLFSDTEPAVSISESSANVILRDQFGTAITTTGPMGVGAGVKDPIHPTWYLLQAGSNDPGDTASPAATFANLQTLWAAARSAGLKVVACTVPKSTSTGYWVGSSGTTVQEGYETLNGLIRSATDEYDALLDVDALLVEDGGATYWTDTAILSDGVHPSTASRKAVMNDLWTLVGSEMP